MNAAAGRPSHCVIRSTSARSASLAVRRLVSRAGVQPMMAASFAQVSPWSFSLLVQCGVQVRQVPPQPLPRPGLR